MELGTRIASWRRAKGLTQRQLADKVGVTDAAVSLWESGRGVRQVNLEAIVQALGLTMAEFYGPTPKPKKAA